MGYWRGDPAATRDLKGRGTAADHTDRSLDERFQLRPRKPGARSDRQRVQGCGRHIGQRDGIGCGGILASFARPTDSADEKFVELMHAIHEKCTDSGSTTASVAAVPIE
jgi:hypothetical protein